MKRIDTKLPGVCIVEPVVHGDHRGYFMETYSTKTFADIGIDTVFVQDNQSFTAQKGTLRGIHFQNAPMSQAKLVRVTRGAVMDVAMSISSSCSELAELNPDISRAQLWRSGMNIGRDAMGTMANTLILAFAGSGLNMLILFRLFDYPLIQVINADAMVIEFIQGVAGSVGIILTVPLVAFISSRIMKK